MHASLLLEFLQLYSVAAQIVKTWIEKIEASVLPGYCCEVCFCLVLLVVAFVFAVSEIKDLLFTVNATSAGEFEICHMGVLFFLEE